MPLQATSGAASYDAFGGGVAAVPNYIEDVFSTQVYTGTGATNNIVNGVDLATYGGLVWTKARTTTSAFSFAHALIDTLRGAGVQICSDRTDANYTQANSLTGFNTNGYTLGTDSGGQGRVNNTSYGTQTYVSWTFRKQPKFFDVVTYTGNSSTRTIAHSLASAPGMIIIKRTTDLSDWWVWHRTFSANEYVMLNSTAAKASGANSFISSDSTGFTIGSESNINGSGNSYVAYLFAHDAGGFGLTGTDNVISCGSFTTDASGNFTTTLGYEPQWILYKNTGSASNWNLIDNMRGWPVGAGSSYLRPNTSGAETTDSLPYMIPTATGFAGINNGFGNTQTYIYIAIRRGPMKVPTSGTSVYYAETVAQTDIQQTSSVPFPTDLVHGFSMNGTNRVYVNQWWDRLRGIGTPSNTFTAGGLVLNSTTTAAETTLNSYLQLKADSQNVTRGSGWNNTLYGNFIYHMFRRAPSFFDEVCYTGTGSARTVTHNLGVAPELMIVKVRSNAANWPVYDQSSGATKAMLLSSTVASFTDSTIWNNTAPTSSVFTVGTSATTNTSANTYVAYLFATCAGVSKCTAFTGTGTLQTIDCGFTAGSRFVLIKRTDAAGDWYVWDSSRGLSSSTDPYLLLNSTAAEVTSTNWVDTTATGFQVTAASGNNVNINGASYIALVIA